MTNNEAKQNAIKEAYGIHWDKVKDYVDENVWVDYGNILFNKEILAKIIDSGINIEFDYLEHKGFRPKSLSGIEDNNGWVKIESEEDLPVESGYYEVTIRDTKVITRASLGPIKACVIYYSHYMPITELKPPLY